MRVRRAPTAVPTTPKPFKRFSSAATLRAASIISPTRTGRPSARARRTSFAPWSHPLFALPSPLPRTPILCMRAPATIHELHLLPPKTIADFLFQPTRATGGAGPRQAPHRRRVPQAPLAKLHGAPAKLGPPPHLPHILRRSVGAHQGNQCRQARFTHVLFSSRGVILAETGVSALFSTASVPPSRTLAPPPQSPPP
jgi:hypothetical protein